MGTNTENIAQKVTENFGKSAEVQGTDIGKGEKAQGTDIGKGEEVQGTNDTNKNNENKNDPKPAVSVSLEQDSEIVTEIFAEEDNIIEETPRIVVCSPATEEQNPEQLNLEDCANFSYLEKLFKDKKAEIEKLLEKCGITETFANLSDVPNDENSPNVNYDNVVSLTAPWIMQKMVDWGCVSLDLNLLKGNTTVSQKAEKLFIMGAGDVSQYDIPTNRTVICDYITAQAYLQLRSIGVNVKAPNNSEPNIILNDRMQNRGGFEQPKN